MREAKKLHEAMEARVTRGIDPRLQRWLEVTHWAVTKVTSDSTSQTVLTAIKSSRSLLSEDRRRDADDGLRRVRGLVHAEAYP